MTPVIPQEINEFWFGKPPYEPRNSLWWQSNEGTDQEIAQRFSKAIQSARRGELHRWQQAPNSALALIILLDQFTRNSFRGSAKAFAGDPGARAMTMRGLALGYIEPLHYLQVVFFLLPLEHSESMAMQDLCVAELEHLSSQHADDDIAVERIGGYLAHAYQHRDIIKQFGRFPHRNAALGRDSTEAETTYLEQGGKRFGQ